MAFKGEAARLYIMTRIVECVAQQQRSKHLTERGIASARNHPPHITLHELHLNFGKLFPSFDSQFRQAHPVRPRQAFMQTPEYMKFVKAFTSFLYKKAFKILQGVELRDPCRDGESADDQNYSLLGQDGRKPFLTKIYNVQDPTNSDKPYITQFRTAVYKFMNRYFGIEGGNYKTSDGTYQYYQKGGTRYYAVPLHSWGVGEWVPHMSVAQINVDGWEKSDLNGNNSLLSFLLKSCRKIRDRSPWEHIKLGGKNTSFSFSLK